MRQQQHATKKKIPQKEGNIQKTHKEYINENIECLTKLIQDTGSCVGGRGHGIK